MVSITDSRALDRAREKSGDVSDLVALTVFVFAVVSSGVRWLSGSTEVGLATGLAAAVATLLLTVLERLTSALSGADRLAP